MTGSALTATRKRPSTPARRALGLEWIHHRDRILLYALLAVAIAVIAAVTDIRLGWIAILLAAWMPATLAEDGTDDGRLQRSALGISRADAVRARTLMVCVSQLVLALGAAAVILLAQWPPEERHWASVDGRPFSFSAPTAMGLMDHLVDIGLWSGALLWAHALVGGSAFRVGERVGKLRAMATFLGVCLVATVLFGVSVAVASAAHGLPVLDDADALSGTGLLLEARLGQILTLLVTLGGGALALVLAHRRWVRRA
ncbi:hypothetical protein [Brachybacterium saurashtrense]|uniref:Uncharacterized protein n=1 Tax=Brachybacterium saurashtrense TaxID=556288 RepID=A0A345YKD3_9MICO|nr:hypothetical protein [Brachybacterium saurashtrense]AXK44385.1 hypothetical protein DWV08_01275 [Brachybacterium saurashtrense]RRR22996.1 hypothetical protein DXU92_06405 [Brachybacterium saurashtrense]